MVVEVKKKRVHDLSGALASLKKSEINIEYIKDAADLKKAQNFKTFSCGIAVLDMIMGFDGFPLGKFIEVYGKESTGKSTLAQHAVNTIVNKYNGIVIIADVEAKSWDFPNRNIALGLDKDKVGNIIYTTPGTVEEVMNAIHDLLVALIVKDGITDRPILIIWDSIASCTTEAERGADIGNIGFMQHARVINQGHRKLVDLMNTHKIDNVTFLWLNQAREAQGGRSSFVPAETVTFGGKAPAFHSAIRLELKKNKGISVVKNGNKVQVGAIVTVNTYKNKLFYPKQKADLYILFAIGIDDAYSSYEWLKEQELIDKKGDTETLTLLNKTTLSFSKVTGFRSVYKQNRDEIVKLMKKTFHDTLATCTGNIMQADVIVDNDAQRKEDDSKLDDLDNEEI